MAPKRGREPPNTGKEKTKKKTRSKYKKQIDLDNLQVPLKNRFAALSEDEDEMSVDAQTKPKKKEKVSPIIVTDVNKDVQKILADLKIKCDIKIVSIGKKIFVQSIDDKNKIIESLKNQKIDFFSHPDDANNTFKVILSGLPEINTNEIIDDMKNTYNIEVTKVVMFNTKSQSKLYLCHINKTKKLNLKILNTIRVVHHHIVKWQAYKPKQQSPTQCYRCCMYGHGARSCNRYAICILCGGGHLTKECTVILPNTDNPEYKCFNCMSAKLPHNHKANDPKCVFRAKYVVTKEKAQNKQKQKPPSKRNANERENNNTDHRYVRAPPPPPLEHTFAAVTGNKPNSQHRTNKRQSASATTNATTFTDTFTQPNSSTELWTITEVAQLLSQSINELLQCSSKLDQLNVIARLLSHACQ